MVSVFLSSQGVIMSMALNVVPRVSAIESFHYNALAATSPPVPNPLPILYPKEKNIFLISLFNTRTEFNFKNFPLCIHVSNSMCMYMYMRAYITDWEIFEVEFSVSVKSIS